MTDKQYATFSVTVEADANWEMDWTGTRPEQLAPDTGSEEDYKSLLYRLCKANYLVLIPQMMSHMYAENMRLEKEIDRLERAQAGASWHTEK